MRLSRLGKRELISVLSVRSFDLRLFGLSVSSWSLGLAAACDVALPERFSYLVLSDIY